jgi:hypothetical protein
MNQKFFPQPPPFIWNKLRVADILSVCYPPIPGIFHSCRLAFTSSKTCFIYTYYTSVPRNVNVLTLRTTKLIPLPKLLPAAGATKEERHRVPVSAESAPQLLQVYWGNDPGAVADEYLLILWNCVNRYVKMDLDLLKTGVNFSKTKQILPCWTGCLSQQLEPGRQPR